MKKDYLKPEIEVIEFDVIEEITATGVMSGTSGDDEWED